MNKKEKALLDKAIPYDYRNPKPIKIFYLLNSHRLYKGFWGKNGYEFKNGKWKKTLRAWWHKIF